MDIHQLKTFVTVAREGSITRASSLLHLSQPAVSAHIKAMEDSLGLSLFERTARGMSLTADGQRLLGKAEQTLSAHQDLMAEASRGKGVLKGRLRIGTGSSANNAALGRLLSVLSARFPSVEVVLKQGSSEETLAGLRNRSLDAGFYNEPGDPEPDLSTLDIAEFTTFVVAAPGLVSPSKRPDWKALSKLPWIYPTESACCARTAEAIFTAHRFKPRRIVSADRQDVTRTLVASKIGVGLLHADTAHEAERRGEVTLVFEATTRVRVLFAHLKSRAHDPLLALATSILREPATE